MDDTFFTLPFVRDAQGPLAWIVTLISVGLMLIDRLSRYRTARRQASDEGQKGQVDRFEAVSEAEARIREVYAKENERLWKENERLRLENENLRTELTQIKELLKVAQGDLREAAEKIERLEAAIS